MSSRKTSPKQNSRRAFDNRAFPIFSGTLLELKNSKSSLVNCPTKKAKSGERFTEKLPVRSKKLSELLAPGGVFALEKRPGEALPETKIYGRSLARKNMVPPRSYFYPQIPQAVYPPRRAIRNRVILFTPQFALASSGFSFFFARLFDEKMVRRGGYREKFGQRLGIYDRDLRARLSLSRGKRPTWLHAVSVGEVMIANKLAASSCERSNLMCLVC